MKKYNVILNPDGGDKYIHIILSTDDKQAAYQQLTRCCENSPKSVFYMLELIATAKAEIKAVIT